MPSAVCRTCLPGTAHVEFAILCFTQAGARGTDASPHHIPNSRSLSYLSPRYMSMAHATHSKFDGTAAVPIVRRDANMPSQPDHPFLGLQVRVHAYTCVYTCYTHAHIPPPA